MKSFVKIDTPTTKKPRLLTEHQLERQEEHGFIPLSMCNGQHPVIDIGNEGYVLYMLVSGCSFVASGLFFCFLSEICFSDFLYRCVCVCVFLCVHAHINS